jgi:dolichyl-phosphate-mannose--protein O-mannosyl transferase
MRLHCTSFCYYNTFTDTKPVTCGSAIKLTHTEAGVHHYLSSEDKNLGSGSGQQIVTWVPQSRKSDPSTLWWVRESNDEDTASSFCKPGTPIRCGDTVRLTHLETKRNLHSHAIPSPLSRQQEISGYGNDGVGDSADDWIVECSNAGSGGEALWMRNAKVRLWHVETGKYLAASANVKYTAQNCGHGCPILNHLEAFGRKQKDDYSYVKVEMGVLLSK